ncbi:hypothetical protein JCM11641_005485 [Rhodosporidiobolus odoratus]
MAPPVPAAVKGKGRAVPSPIAPSHPSQPTSNPLQDQSNDLALALDGSFIETTSAAVARAMAKFHAVQAGQGDGGQGWEQNAVQQIQRDGKTIYRIRPLASPPTSPTSSGSSSSPSTSSSAASGHLPFARPSNQPLPSISSASPSHPTIALHRSSFRSIDPFAPRRASLPEESVHSGDPALLSPVNAFPSTLSPSSAQPATPALRKSGSSPTLTSAPRFPSGFNSAPNLDRMRRSPSSFSAAAAEADVLGRILGWRGGFASGEGSRGKSGGRAGRAGTARLGMPQIFQMGGGRKGSTASKGSKGSKGSRESENSDESDLPDDSVVEALDASRIPEHPFALFTKRFSVSRNRPSSRSRSLVSPFGSGVRIPRLVPPATRPDVNAERPQHAMREVSSNDSIRTARADDPSSHIPTPLAIPPSPSPASDSSVEQPAALPRRRFEDPAIFDLFHRADLAASSSPSPPGQFGQHGRLPSSASIASSVRSDSSTPAQQITVLPSAGDDPRFIIWGVQDPPPSAVPPTSPPLPQGRRPSAVQSPKSPPRSDTAAAAGDLRRESIPEEGGPGGRFASPASSSSAVGSPTSGSRRWSISQRGSSGEVSSPATSLRDSVDSANGPGGTGSAKEPHLQRILMAASVERLVVELTSEISAELLPTFFLTYRHYLAPLDLLRLLLARFEWAMSPPSTSLAHMSSAQLAEDEALRRVVRVRTFVVLRYWLINSHYMEDFDPSREMKTTLTNWLNERSRDERYKASPKDMRLVKQLKKAVRTRKESLAQGHQAKVKSTTSSGEEDVDLEEELRPAVSESSDGPTNPTATITSSPPSGSVFNFGSLRGGLKGKLFPLAPPTSSMPFSDTASFASSAFPLSDPETSAQNPIARSFSSAVGSIGRFRRKLVGTSTSPRSGPPGAMENGLEVERNEKGDLYLVKGGVEAYLRYWGVEMAEHEALPVEETEEVQRVSLAVPEQIAEEEEDDPSADDANTPRPDEPALETPPAAQDATEALGLAIITGDEPPVVVQPVASAKYAFPPRPDAHATLDSPFALSSSAPSRPPIPIFDLESYDSQPSYDSYTPYGFMLDPTQPRPHSLHLELDDLDDSSDDGSDDEDVVAIQRAIKPALRANKLRLGKGGPAQRLRSSVRRTSMASYRSSISAVGDLWATDYGPELPRRRRRNSDPVSFVSERDSNVVYGIPGFYLDGLLDTDDEEEPGDVEAALKRLEGIVDVDKQKERAARVEARMGQSERLRELGQLRQARIEEGLPYDDLDDEENDLRKTPSSSRKVSLAIPTTDRPAGGPDGTTLVAAVAAATGVAPPPAPQEPTLAGYATQTSPPLSRMLSRRITTSPPSPPTDLPSFRKPSISRILSVAARPLSTRPGFNPSASAKNAPPAHRSFVLLYPSSLIAQTFALVERDSLRMVSYQELVSGAWRSEVQFGETDVLDWEAYLKERRRSDMLRKEKGETVRSAVQDMVARFNLTANWVGSEILLTANVDERAALVAKFIRVAIKCFAQNNLQTLTQIIHGLQIPDVERLKKTWTKVPRLEMQRFRALKGFVSHLKNFKHLREYSKAMIADFDSITPRTPELEAVHSRASKGCIPFLGLYLRDLAFNAELPTFLDPTSPNTPASVSATGTLTSVVEPTAFDQLPPLPACAPLVPLVNVHKTRLLAATVNNVIKFQQLAERLSYDPDPEVFHKCLRIRCLSQGVMHELSLKLEA